MKCPECDKLGQKSKCWMNSVQTCCLVLHPSGEYYDENEVYHDHTIPCNYGGGNVWSCSNGHTFRVPEINKCPNCDWKSTVEQSYGMDIKESGSDEWETENGDKIL